MVTYTKSALQEKLQEEFCPPLDTTLLAALIADIYLDADPPTEAQIESLHQTLSLLATHADEEELAAGFAERTRVADDDSARSSTLDGSSPASYTTSPTSSYSLTSTPTTTRSSPPSESFYTFGDFSELSSPLGFLQAAFPDIPAERLQNALADVGYTLASSSQDGEVGGPDADLDLVAVIEGLLTKEYLKDLEERGLTAVEHGVPDTASLALPAKTSKGGPTQVKKKGKKKGVTLALNDVRQQHHVRPSSASRSGVLTLAPDPWTQLSSLSSLLSSFIPAYQPSFFQSFFHKQSLASDSSALATPANTIRTVLANIALKDCKVSKVADNDASEEEHDLNPEATILLFNLYDLIRSNETFSALSPSAQSQIFNDTVLAVRATNADPSSSLDIAWLLCDLDQQAEAEWTPSPTTPGGSGATSLAVPLFGRAQPQPQKKHMQALPDHPPSIAPVPSMKQQSLKSKGKGVKAAPPTNPWTTVPLKKAAPGPNPLAASIPAYNPLNGVSAKKLRKLTESAATGESAAAEALAMGVKNVDPKEAQKQKRRIDKMGELGSKRHEAIVKAGRAWMGGNAKNRGGEVAMFYAEQARSLQEQARKEALSAARFKVEGTRITGENGTTVDLHGTTTAEAVTIAKEVLAECGATPAQPLKFITGRGNHSVNRVGVLGPAVRSALIEDGWNISTFDAGLVVRGRL